MGATSQLPARPRGIALLMALAVVMLLTVFMSEYFFATGLELRAMTTYREAQQARSLAKAVFKVVQIGMFQDEVDFFKGYRQVAELLQFAAVPWADGLLISLEVVSVFVLPMPRSTPAFALCGGVGRHSRCPAPLWFCGLGRGQWHRNFLGTVGRLW